MFYELPLERNCTSFLLLLLLLILIKFISGTQGRGRANALNMKDHICQYLMGLSFNFLPVIRSSVQCVESFLWLFVPTPPTPNHGVNKFTSDPGKLELEKPGNSLSRRIHLSNPQALLFTPALEKACLTQCTKRKNAIVDHHYTILCFPRANIVLSLLVKLGSICLFSLW